MAATGSALANAVIVITDGTGHPACQEASISTTASGSYTCTLASGATAPFFIVATDPSGNTPQLVGVSTAAPTAGASQTANATPLTTAIVAQLAPDGNPLTVVSSNAVDTAALARIKANVVAQISGVLSAVNAPAGYDPFTTSISAASAAAAGSASDIVLDLVQIVTDPASGKPALTTVADPTPVVLATDAAAGSTVSAPPAGTTSLAQAAQATAQALSACFQLPASQRAVTIDTTLTAAQGGPSVTSMASACQDIFATASGPAGIDFLHNGYSAGQLFYSALTSDSATGIQFGVPAILAFYPAASNPSGRDEGVFNIRYVDKAGNPGSQIVVVQNIPGASSAAHPSTWWVTGNQQPVDITARPLIRRIEQLATAPVAGSVPSRFQNGIQFLVNATGPGSVLSGQPLNYALVTGPGLPAAGLVYMAPVAAEGSQYWMDLANKTGIVPVSYQCGNTAATVAANRKYNCPNFWFSATTGITGAAATTLASNPASLTWAQAADNVNASLVVAGAKYTVRLFYGSSTTPAYTITKTLWSNLLPATLGATLPWNAPGTNALAALDPTNATLAAAQTSLLVDWTQNPLAEQIGTLAVTIDAKGNFSPSQSVPKGALSATLANVSVPALAATTTRALLYNYRMLDNSSKSADYSYN